MKTELIEKLKELVNDLASLINSEDAIAIGLKGRLSDLSALEETKGERLTDEEIMTYFNNHATVRKEMIVKIPMLTRSDAIDMVRHFESRFQSPELREELIKKISTDFFRYWWNTSGTNTDQGFDDWWKKNKDNYLNSKSEK